MTFAELLIAIVVIYILYKFVFELVLPISRKTKEIRQQFSQFQNGANPNAGSTNAQSTYTEPQNSENTNTKSTSSREGEYIDFEEIKD